MKKLFYLIFLSSLLSCDDGITPKKIVDVKLDIFGNSENVFVVVGHGGSSPTLVTPYNNVTLPFYLHNFNLESGDTLYFAAVKFDTLIMTGQIKVNNEVKYTILSKTDFIIRYIVENYSD